MTDWIIIIFAGILGGVFAPYLLKVFTSKNSITKKENYSTTVHQRHRILISIVFILSSFLLFLIVLFLTGFINLQMPQDFVLNGKSLMVIVILGVVLGIFHLLILKMLNKKN